MSSLTTATQLLSGGYNSTGYNPKNPGFVPAGLAGVGSTDGSVEPQLRNSSKVLQHVRVDYVIRTSDVAQGWATVAVKWPETFPDTNYSLWFSIDDKDPVVGLDYYQGDVHNKSNDGFIAVVYMYSPGVGTPGDTVTINALAIHD